MADINPEFIERYQLLYQKDPNSKIFAPLAEAYRKMGMLKEAMKVANKGVELHPSFPSGRVALAKVLIDLKKSTEAIEHLEKAVALSPENVLAHTLLAKSYLELKKPRKALHAYKMLLFLNPNHTLAQNMVKKLESLEAEDFEEEVFSIRKLGDNIRSHFIDEKMQEELSTQHEKNRYLERCLSLADAFLARNDYEKALSCLLAARERLGKIPEVEKRLLLIHEREEEPDITTKASPIRKKIAFLERLLLRIEKNQALT
tara:strand:- start:12063 stop:12839 length:777 start_codon:yes stop_codon:yes gene_type:complete